MIDTPERDQAPYGAMATDAIDALLRGQPVLWLELDVGPTDQYGRTLAYLWLDDGRMVNEEMARSGFAVALVYPPSVRHVDRIRAAVEEAREARRGLWATDAFGCEPVDHRAGRC
jgi:micrococcal nuclease